MQSLLFSRASVSDGAISKCLTRVMVGGLILRDTFARPPCPLVQPSMNDDAEEILQIPDFGKDFCPPIYPLGDQKQRRNDRAPLMSLHSLRFFPSLSPPSFSSQTVIDCKPLMIHLQAESCLRILSFLSDGVVVNPGDLSPDISIYSFQLNIKDFNITVPLEASKCTSFKGARLHIENLFFSESPSLNLGLLNLDMDAACYCMWEGQSIDSSQKKYETGASLITLSLDTCNNPIGSELWRCVEMNGVCIQVAMVTSDGSTLKNIPPPGGIVRVGIACEQFMSNTSVEQLFYVLDFYAYTDNVIDQVAKVANANKKTAKNESFGHGNFTEKGEKGAADTAISLALKNLNLTFLESSSTNIQGTPLVQFIGDDLLLQVTHRTLGAAMAVSSTVRWEKVQVDCATNGISPSGPDWKSVFWVQNRTCFRSNRNGVLIPFLSLNIVHVIPSDVQDTKCHSLRVMARIEGVRLVGGMNYNEALLHRFGILGPGGGPGDALSRGLERLSSGPLSKLFKASPPFVNEVRESQNESILNDKNSSYLNFGAPDDVNVSLEFKDWQFSVESAEVMSEKRRFEDLEDSFIEQKSWHTSFESFKVKANGSKNEDSSIKAHKYPVEAVTVGIEGLMTMKPQQKENSTKTVQSYGGIDLEVDILPSEDNNADGMITWSAGNLKISTKDAIEVVVKKDELQHVTNLCKLEIDSMGRITVGILRLLKLDRSVGQAALNQLSHLGSEGFEEIFSPRKSTTDTKPTTFDRVQSSLAPSDTECCFSFDSTLSSLEAEVFGSQSICAAVSAELSTSESSNPHVHNMEQLAQKLDSMQRLLTRLRSQV